MEGLCLRFRDPDQVGPQPCVGCGRKGREIILARLERELPDVPRCWRCESGLPGKAWAGRSTKAFLLNSDQSDRDEGFIQQGRLHRELNIALIVRGAPVAGTACSRRRKNVFSAARRRG